MHWANIEVRALMPVHHFAYRGWTIIEFEGDSASMLALRLEPVTYIYIRRIHHDILEP